MTGLKGANFYHDFHPFIKGVSKRTYTDEELDRMNEEENTPKKYGDKEYTTYEALQRQRMLETTMRAQRQEIHLLKTGNASEEDILNAQSRYSVTSAEYIRFSEQMGLPQQRERVTVDVLGKIGVNCRFVSGKTVAKSGESGIMFVEPLSRYLNSSDKLFEYSRKVKPIDGYEDVFIHGDKNGFALREKNGNEHTYLTPREFAELLKEDPNYNGGDIRLFACETGADGAMAAKALATQLGVNVLAPSDIIWIDFEGNYIIGPDKYTNNGKWIKYMPYRKE